MALLFMGTLVLPTGAQGSLPPYAAPVFPVGTGEKGAAPYPKPGALRGNVLKSALIAATMRAIRMEILCYENELRAAKEKPGNSTDIARLDEKIADLKSELAEAARLEPSNYSLPKTRRVRVSAKKPYNYGSILDIDGSGKKKPVYYAAGILGDDFSMFEVGNKYALTIYLLWPKDSESGKKAGYYVYIMAPSEPGPGFKAPDSGTRGYF